MTKCKQHPISMHELSLCEDLLEQVLNIAKKNHAEYVESITLNIGPLAGIEPLLLENAFSILKVSTLAENAELIIESSPVIIVCNDCNQQSTVSVNYLICNLCQSNNSQLISGNELILANLALYTAS